MSGPGEWDEHTWDDLLNLSTATPDEVRDALRRGMGEGQDVPPRRQPGRHPDVGGLAEGLGLR